MRNARLIRTACDDRRPSFADGTHPGPGDPSTDPEDDALMPHVADGEAFDRSFLDLDVLADELGPPPWRSCLVGTSALRVMLLHWPAGYSSVPHVHPAAEEIFRVIRGRAFFTIGDEPEREVGPGDFMFARRGVRHAIRVPTAEPLVFLAAVAPNEDHPDETIELA